MTPNRLKLITEIVVKLGLLYIALHFVIKYW